MKNWTKKNYSYLISVDDCSTEDQEDTEFVDDALVDGGDGGLVLVQDQADQLAGDHGHEEDHKYKNIIINHVQIF